MGLEYGLTANREVPTDVRTSGISQIPDVISTLQNSTQVGRVKDIILNDMAAMGIWVVFTLLFLLLELMLVIVKWISAKTFDDMREDLQMIKAKSQYELAKREIADFERNSKKYDQDKGSYRAISQGTVS